MDGGDEVKTRVKEWYAKYKRWLWFGVEILLLITFVESLGTKRGLLAGFSLLGALYLVRLYNNRVMLLLALRQLETVFFGKPLDRALWSKEERVKIRRPHWRKHDD